MNETNNNETNNVLTPVQFNEPEKKGNKLVPIIIVVILLVAIGVGLYFYFNKEDDSTNNNANNNTNNNTNENTNNNTNAVKTTDFTGVYENENVTIKLYGLEDNKVHYDITTTDSNASGEAELEGASAKAEIFDTKYEFKITNNNLELVTNDENIKAGTYPKLKDYTINDYYNDCYGKVEYLTSKYNGDYSTEKTKVYVYQEDENEVRIYMLGTSGLSDLLYEIKEDGSLYTSQFDSTYTATFDGDKMTYQSKEKDGSTNSFDGTYTKVKTLTVEDIVKNVQGH